MHTNQVVSGDWHPAQVKAALEMAGTNLSELARKHGYAHINEVLHRPWVAAERIVAAALNKAPEEIWPKRYERCRARAILLTRKVPAKAPTRAQRSGSRGKKA